MSQDHRIPTVDMDDLYRPARWARGELQVQGTGVSHGEMNQVKFYLGHGPIAQLLGTANPQGELIKAHLRRRPQRPRKEDS